MTGHPGKLQEHLARLRARNQTKKVRSILGNRENGTITGFVGRFRSLAGAALFIALLAGCGGEPQPPYLNKFLVKTSPKGTHEATFYNYGKGGGSGFLGATVTSTMYVNVRRRGEPFDPEQGQIFSMRHGYRVRLVWQDEHHLRIDYPSDADVLIKRPQSGAVSILFRPATHFEVPEPYKVLPSAGIPSPLPTP